MVKKRAVFGVVARKVQELLIDIKDVFQRLNSQYATLKRRYEEANKTNKDLLDLRKNQERFFKACTTHHSKIKKAVTETMRDSMEKVNSPVAAGTPRTQKHSAQDLTYLRVSNFRSQDLKLKCCCFTTNRKIKNILRFWQT